MLEAINKHLREFKSLLETIECTDANGSHMVLTNAIANVCSFVHDRFLLKGKVMFIGNGGSAAISSHMAIDFWKNGHIPAITFNDGSLLTCIANDFGYRHVFEEPLRMFAAKSDILFAISSSGRSENILNGVKVARLKGCGIVTFSGFMADNSLRTLGDYNFYVPYSEYGHVEVTHQYICHCILDVIISTYSV